MRRGEGSGGSARIAMMAWAVLVSLALIACGPDSAEQVSAEKPRPSSASEQMAVNPAKITLKEYAALDEETRVAIARSFAEKNAQGIAVLTAKEEKKREAVPEGSVYMAAEFDLSRLPNDADIDSHLMSIAADQPGKKVSAAAADFVTEKNIDVTKVVARTK